MIKKWAAYLLLAAFGLMLTPMRYWHDCDQQHHTEKKHSHHQSQINKGSCDICDIDLLPYIKCQAYQAKFESAAYAQQEYADIQIAHARIIRHFLRGPPTC